MMLPSKYTGRANMKLARSLPAAALSATMLLAGAVATEAASLVNVKLEDPSAGVGIRKMQIVLTPDQAPAGPVTFRIKNESTTLVHEMLLLRRPASGKLPYNQATQRVIESKTVKLIDSDDIQPGGSKTETATLPPGAYLAICNQPGHYAQGMRTRFAVTP
jgi:uncharacterized cupredoxin-like copper-binding protein